MADLRALDSEGLAKINALIIQSTEELFSLSFLPKRAGRQSG